MAFTPSRVVSRNCAPNSYFFSASEDKTWWTLLQIGAISMFVFFLYVKYMPKYRMNYKCLMKVGTSKEEVFTGNKQLSVYIFVKSLATQLFKLGTRTFTFCNWILIQTQNWIKLVPIDISCKIFLVQNRTPNRIMELKRKILV